jgi:NCAIR mutase (PurE)-related protein
MMSDGPVPDVNRRQRTGIPEVVYADGKDPDVVADLLAAIHSADDRAALATRCSQEAFDEARRRFGAAAVIDPVARTITLGVTAPLGGRVVIVTAGTTDLPVAYECRNAAAAFGLSADVIGDVGIAGLQRLLDRIDVIRGYDIVIVIAGMDGALPAVVAGLVRAPVIAVPSSVGYGIASGGHAALNTMLASCSPGLAVVNIDNGLGAAALAARIVTAFRPAGEDTGRR